MTSTDQPLLPSNFTLAPTIYPSQCILISKDPDSAIDQNDEDDHFVLLKSKTGHILYRQAVMAANFLENIHRSYDVLNDPINLQKYIQKEIKGEYSTPSINFTRHVF